MKSVVLPPTTPQAIVQSIIIEKDFSQIIGNGYKAFVKTSSIVRSSIFPNFIECVDSNGNNMCYNLEQITKIENGYDRLYVLSKLNNSNFAKYDVTTYFVKQDWEYTIKESVEEHETKLSFHTRKGFNNKESLLKEFPIFFGNIL